MSKKLAGAWSDESPRLTGRWVGLVAAIVMAVVGGASILCVGGLLGALVLIVRHGVAGATDLANLSGDAMAITFFGGFGTFAVLGAIIVVALGWKPQHAFAVRMPPLATLGIAVVGGLCVGVFPGWIADQLIRNFPELASNGTLELIPRLLMDGTVMDRVLTLATIVIGAPLLEELCFRGLLWGALERVAPGHNGQLLAFILTSLAFVVAHADPIQSPALVLTALFLGWLRWSSGSIWPSMLAHFVNNSLAAGLTLAALTYEWETEAPTPLWLGLTGLAITVVLSAVLVAVRRTPAATPETLRPQR